MIGFAELASGGLSGHTVTVDDVTVETTITSGLPPGERGQIVGNACWYFRVNGGRWIRFVGSSRSMVERARDLATLLELMHEHGVLEEFA